VKGTLAQDVKATDDALDDLKSAIVKNQPEERARQPDRTSSKLTP
jgi:hypothetical protein